MNLKLTTNLLYECTGFCDEIKARKTGNINGIEWSWHDFVCWPRKLTQNKHTYIPNITLLLRELLPRSKQLGYRWPFGNPFSIFKNKFWIHGSFIRNLLYGQNLIFILYEFIIPKKLILIMSEPCFFLLIC